MIRNKTNQTTHQADATKEADIMTAPGIQAVTERANELQGINGVDALTI